MKPGAPPRGYDEEQEESPCKGRLNLKPGTSAKRYQRCPPRRGNSMKPGAPPRGYDEEQEESPCKGRLNLKPGTSTNRYHRRPPRRGSLNPSWK